MECPEMTYLSHLLAIAVTLYRKYGIRRIRTLDNNDYAIQSLRGMGLVKV
jgi:GTP cyclohydrolase II